MQQTQGWPHTGTPAFAQGFSEDQGAWYAHFLWVLLTLTSGYITPEIMSSASQITNLQKQVLVSF